MLVPLMSEEVRAFVESCDVVLMLGARLTDGNAAGGTVRLDPAKVISVDHHRTTVGSTVYRNVEIGDVLAQAVGACHQTCRAAGHRTGDAGADRGRWRGSDHR